MFSKMEIIRLPALLNNYPLKLLICRARIRTCVNVWGDCVGVAVIEKLSKRQLIALQDEEKNYPVEEKIEMLENVVDLNDSRTLNQSS